MVLFLECLVFRFPQYLKNANGYLYAKSQVEYAVRRVGVPIRFLHLLNKHAEGVVQFVGPQLQDVRLEGLHVTALSPSFFQFCVLPDYPVLPRVDTVCKLLRKNEKELQ